MPKIRRAQAAIRRLGYLSAKTASSKWVNWEIEESIKRGNGVIGVYKGDKAPASVPPAFGQNGCKSVKWEDYAAMTPMIFGTAPTFAVVMDSVARAEGLLNGSK